MINLASPSIRIASLQLQTTPSGCCAESHSFTRQVAPARANQRCPSCGSIIYTRRHRLCGVCSHPLPEEFLFSITEAKRIESLLEGERQRHRTWLARNFVLC